jgi:Family of unknown function (DUF6308)
MTRQAFARRAHKYVSTNLEQQRAAACLASYRNEYTGAWFETIPDRSQPNTFTAADLLAVSMLAVNVGPNAAAWILGGGAQELSSLLGQIRDIDIWDPKATVGISPKGPAEQLWTLLQQGRWPTANRANGIGPVIAGKLLAAKRPGLIPVWDQWVHYALRPDGDDFWMSMQYVFQDEAFRGNLKLVVAHAESLVNNAAPPMPKQLLRVFDIIVWMRAHGCASSSDPKVSGLRGKLP